MRLTPLLSAHTSREVEFCRSALMKGVVIDEDPAHHLRCDPEEVGAALPVAAALSDQPKVGFVDERGRLQRMSAPLQAKLTRGDPPQFRVDERQQAIESAPIAAAPVAEQSRDVMTCGHRQL